MSFFPMQRAEAAALLFLIAFSVFAFFPVWRTTEIWGMAVFGWLIAALMVLSPALALLTFMGKGSEAGASGDGHAQPSAESDAAAATDAEDA